MHVNVYFPCIKLNLFEVIASSEEQHLKCPILPSSPLGVAPAKLAARVLPGKKPDLVYILWRL